MKRINFSNNFSLKASNSAIKLILNKHLSNINGLYFQNLKSMATKTKTANIFPEENESIESLLKEINTLDSSSPHVHLRQKGINNNNLHNIINY